MKDKYHQIIAYVWIVFFVFVFGLETKMYLDKCEAKQKELAEIQETKRTDAYILGFVRGAAYQEVYRFKNPNYDTNPILDIEETLVQAHKNYEEYKIPLDFPKK